jgi:NADH-quinone oxidoreductase subunit C
MVIERIEAQLPGAILDRHAFRGDQTVVVAGERFLDVVDCVFREGFQLLLDVTAVDQGPVSAASAAGAGSSGSCDRGESRELRFDVVYHLLNLASQERLRIKVPVAEGASQPSLTGRFKSADWAEREVYDMFGIRFQGHPNLARLLMWEDFPGYPLRKDFPLDGGDRFCNQDIGVPFAPDARSLYP